MNSRTIAGARAARLRDSLGLTVLSPIPVLLVLLAAPQQAVAQDSLGATVICDGVGDPDCCMDDLFPGNLGCTANDVRVSGVADTGTTNMDGSCSDGPDGFLDECDIDFEPVCDVGASNVGADCSMDPSICLDGNGIPDPSLCGDRCAFEGDTASFTATFVVELTAQARFDIGLYFAVDGDPNGDGALTGDCSVSTLPEVGSFTRPDSSTGSYVDLDSTCKGGGCPQPQDLCGDIDNDNNPIFYDPAVGGGFAKVVCVANENGKLNLPNCTSWRQSGANDVCLDPLDAFPGAPSKCNCQPDFEAPINVPQAELLVVKTANPTSVSEPGGPVTFSVSVTNQGVDPNNDVTLNSLEDDIYGNLDADDVGNHTWLTSTCLDDADGPVVITPGGTYTCSFTANVSGNGGDSETDTVTASGVDDNGNDISGEDDATVDILDVLPAIDVTKTADPTSVLEGAGETVTFTVVVDNDSTADELELLSLTDNIHGDLNGQGDCSVPQTIAVGGSYSCSFTAVVDGPAFSSETDTVTAVGIDDEFVDDATTPNNKVSANDSATVNINDDEAMIALIKDASPTEVDEPGDNVTFTVTVNNLSTVDTVTINSLTDDQFGNLDGQGDCSVTQILASGGSYSCSFVGFVAGDGGDSHTNVATAMGVDDDGQAVMASDDATVDVLDVPPAASLTKTAVMAVVTYEVTVTNDSAAEQLTLNTLDDDVYGDIADAANPNIISTTCSVPRVLDPDDAAPGGTDTYTCSFEAMTMTSPTVDTVTGTVSDNEGGSVTPSDSAEVRFGDNVCE